MAADRGSAADSEHDELLFFLNRVRHAVVRDCAGLTEEQLRAPGVPSGTNLCGLVRHLTAMEVKWFQRVFLGEGLDRDESMDVPDSASSRDVVAAYQEACARSNRILAACPDLSTLSRGTARLPGSTWEGEVPMQTRQASLRSIVAHMIEETARHAGHADIIREQIDGATDL